MNAPIPGPTGADMLRNARRMRNDPLGFLRDVAAEHGDLVAFPVPRRPAMLVNHPDGVRRILQSNHRGYDRGTVQYRTLSIVTGGGLLTTDGDRWLRHRRLMQPAFHKSAVTDVARHTATAVRRRTEEWQSTPSGTVVDVDAAMMRSALEVVGGALFSTDLSGDAAELTGAVLVALDQVIARARNPLIPPPRVPTPGNRRLNAALRTLDAAVDRMIDARLAAGAAAGPDAARADLLGLLLAAHDDHDQPFARQELRDEVVTLIVAGHETVAAALTWTWHLLAGAPDVEERLHAEVDAVVGRGRDLTAADLASLPWTRAVVDEALRLYPPAWLISRRAVADDEVLGHTVRAGSWVFLSPWVLHRHPAIWAQPDSFAPERFLTAGGAAAAGRFAYVPFGAGPNLCIGRDFALLEAVLTVAGLASRFRLVRPAGAAPVVADPLVTIRPVGGLPLRLTPR